MSIALLQVPLVGPDEMPPGIDTAVVVQTVQRGSPADACGLRQGDVIVAINGKPMHKRGVYFDELGPVYVPGKSLECSVMRPARSRIGTVTWAPLTVQLTPLPDHV
jgi:S1-C subfamily serine protease